MLGELLKNQDAQALRAKNRIVMIVYGAGLSLSPIGLLMVLDAHGWAVALATMAGIVLSLPFAVLSLRKTSAPSDRLIALLLVSLGLPIVCLIFWRYLNDLADGQIDLNSYRTWRYVVGGPCVILGSMWLYWRELKRLRRSSLSVSQTVR
ncbi:hypothetical protein [Asticcacaulis sp.]|uniref:hypothetical protein n=1 Tax=Asticcacaulis sp. TaxID=1872648 RepID=UPI002BAF8442|nr:hypothetical protein [Asticcacaulis sp.]HTM81815.1 hypothetical protein [Asticcacaulis sp.]